MGYLVGIACDTTGFVGWAFPQCPN